MKKATPPKLVRQLNKKKIYFFYRGERLTSSRLREIADEMDRDKYENINLLDEEGSWISWIETDEELAARQKKSDEIFYRQETRDYKKYLELQKRFKED